MNRGNIIGVLVLGFALGCFFGGPVLAIYTGETRWLLLMLIGFPFLWA